MLGQCMRVGGVHVGSVIAGQRKGGVLDSIWGQYMKVIDVHVHRDGDFDGDEQFINEVMKQT